MFIKMLPLWLVYTWSSGKFVNDFVWVLRCPLLRCPLNGGKTWVSGPGGGLQPRPQGAFPWLWLWPGKSALGTRLGRGSGSPLIWWRILGGSAWEEYLFQFRNMREKWYIKARVRGWTSGGASSHKHFLSTLPPSGGFATHKKCSFPQNRGVPSIEVTNTKIM